MAGGKYSPEYLARGRGEITAPKGSPEYRAQLARTRGHAGPTQGARTRNAAAGTRKRRLTSTAELERFARRAPDDRIVFLQFLVSGYLNKGHGGSVRERRYGQMLTVLLDWMPASRDSKAGITAGRLKAALREHKTMDELAEYFAGDRWTPPPTVEESHVYAWEIREQGAAK